MSKRVALFDHTLTQLLRWLSCGAADEKVDRGEARWIGQVVALYPKPRKRCKRASQRIWAPAPSLRAAKAVIEGAAFGGLGAIEIVKAYRENSRRGIQDEA